MRNMMRGRGREEGGREGGRASVQIGQTESLLAAAAAGGKWIFALCTHIRTQNYRRIPLVLAPLVSPRFLQGAVIIAKC